MDAIKTVAVNCGILLFTLMSTILFLEIGARWYANETKDVYSFENFLSRERDLFRRDAKAAFDPELGWVPKEGSYSYPSEGTKVTILEGGIRSNGYTETVRNRNLIVAVGDSFTFGDDVSDNETWPAILEKFSNTKVINGGVFGYGIDQAYLRMKVLVAKYSPSIVIFSFIEDDIPRCELSERTGVPKPYFFLSKNDELILQTNHVSSYTAKELPFQLDTVRKILGYSFLVHKLMARAFPEYWLLGYKYISKKSHADANGLKISCAIFKKLASYAKEKNIKIYVLVQYDDDDFNSTSFQYRSRLNRLWSAISCIDQSLLKLIDTRSALVTLKDKDNERFTSFYRGHMTILGNEFMASIVWKEISADLGGAVPLSVPSTLER